jgi:hypothetical protein
MRRLRHTATGEGTVREAVALEDEDLVNEVPDSGGREHACEAAADDDGALRVRLGG